MREHNSRSDQKLHVMGMDMPLITDNSAIIQRVTYHTYNDVTAIEGEKLLRFTGEGSNRKK
jgi:hypothetical protein